MENSTFKLVKTEMTKLGLASTYEVETFFNSGSVVVDSKKKVSAAFKIIFDMKNSTRPQKVRAINKAGLDLSIQEWDTLTTTYADYF